MWVKIDFNRLALLLVPTVLRKPRVSALVQCLVSPIKFLYEEWLWEREQNLYLLKHTGQVCSLRKSLNDTFDVIPRRIRIGNGVLYRRKYLYTAVENYPRFLGRNTTTLYLRTAEEYADTGVDFWIIAPKELQPEAFRIRAWTNQFKQDVKRYSIKHE